MEQKVQQKKEVMFEIPDNPYSPLTDEILDYENLMQNPVLKPIAEAERSLNDMDEMIFKKLSDANRDDIWIQQCLHDIPTYSDSQFISRQIKLYTETSDVIKLLMIQNNTLRDTIKDMIDIIKMNYGVKVASSSPQPVQKEERIDYTVHLEEVINTAKDEAVREAAKKVLEKLNANPDNKSDKDKFKIACADCYKDEKDREKKKIIQRILELKS